MPSDPFHGILGIFETHLPVSDMPRSIAFYRDTLGLNLAAEFPERGIAFIARLVFHGEPITEPNVHGWMPAVAVHFSDPDRQSVE